MSLYKFRSITWVLLDRKTALLQHAGRAYKMCRLCKTCGGCRGYSDLPLKVSGERIISSYLLLLSKLPFAHLAPSFPFLSLLWKLNHVRDAARAAKVRYEGETGMKGWEEVAFCSWAIPVLPCIPTSSFPWDIMETLTHCHPDCACAWPHGAQYCLEHVFCKRGAQRAGRSLEAHQTHSPKAVFHPHPCFLIQALSHLWCLKSGLFSSPPFLAFCSFLHPSSPSVEALLQVGDGERNASSTGWRGWFALWVYAWMEL